MLEPIREKHKPRQMSQVKEDEGLLLNSAGEVRDPLFQSRASCKQTPAKKKARISAGRVSGKSQTVEEEEEHGEHDRGNMHGRGDAGVLRGADADAEVHLGAMRTQSEAQQRDSDADDSDDADLPCANAADGSGVAAPEVERADVPVHSNVM